MTTKNEPVVTKNASKAQNIPEDYSDDGLKTNKLLTTEPKKGS